MANQHTIQKSWLKQFAKHKKVRRTLKLDLSYFDEDPDDLSYIVDFQSEENEASDSAIESKGIRILHGIKKSVSYEIRSRHGIDNWTALHLSRNPRDIQGLTNSEIDYDRGKDLIFAESLKLVQGFPEVWAVHFVQNSEPLVLADHPIVRWGKTAFVLPYSPSVLVAYCEEDPNGWIFEGRSLSEAMNEMSFANASRYVYSGPTNHPNFSELKARCEFRVKKSIESTKIYLDA